VSAGLLAVKAKPLRGGLRPALTAPTPSGIGSYARNREKSGQELTASAGVLPCCFSGFILPRYRAPTGGGIVAQRVVLIDDLDESEAAETITYMINGQDYEIDLLEENAQRFYDTLGTFIEKSRRVERQAAPTARRNGRRRGGGRWSSRPR